MIDYHDKNDKWRGKMINQDYCRIICQVIIGLTFGCIPKDYPIEFEMYEKQYLVGNSAQKEISFCKKCNVIGTRDSICRQHETDNKRGDLK